MPVLFSCSINHAYFIGQTDVDVTCKLIEGFHLNLLFSILMETNKSLTVVWWNRG